MLLGVSSTFSTYSTRLINPCGRQGTAAPTIRTTHGRPLYIFYTVKPVRAAEDCRPYRWDDTRPPILHILHGKLTRAGGRGLPPLPLGRHTAAHSTYSTRLNLCGGRDCRPYHMEGPRPPILHSLRGKFPPTLGLGAGRAKRERSLVHFSEIFVCGKMQAW